MNELINTGDTAWMLVATAMVMLMTPAGLALFYGGLSNKKNVINTVGMSYISICLASILWVAVGYTLAFGEGGLFVGSLDDLFLIGTKITDVSGTIPKLLFIAFQGVFAAIAVAIISGSVIERMKFSTWMVFASLWVICIYCPLVHWIWGDGWLSGIGDLDFAGGTVIHINAGVSGLVLSLLIGKRNKKKGNTDRPSSLKLTVLGTALLWFGWFGFNAGSQLAADAIAANAFLVTNIAAAAGALGWLLCEWNREKKPTLLGLSSGTIAGLVGITPAAGYVDVSGAMLIGFGGGLIGYLAVMRLKHAFGYDDTLDAFGIHGVVGIWGALATGLFANPEINGEAGLFFGNAAQMLPQIVAVLVTIVFAAIGSIAIYWISSLLTSGGRVNQQIESKGLDATVHQEVSFVA